MIMFIISRDHVKTALAIQPHCIIYGVFAVTFIKI